MSGPTEPGAAGAPDAPGAEPPSPEELVGKDEIDEDDEMELTGNDLLGDEDGGGA
jgi:hypothetical protein